jgi:hypothetical protein
MLRYIASIVAASLLIAITCIPKVSAETASPEQPFLEMDQFFVKQYNALAAYNQNKTRPTIVISGFNFTLLREDGTRDSFQGLISRSAELKGVAHLGPCLFAIASSHLNNPKDESWRKQLTDLREIIRRALVSVEVLDWSNEAWPGAEGKLKDYVRASLNRVDETAAKWITAGKISGADYSAFATDYTPNMVALFYLETLGGTYKILTMLNRWKQEVGDESWKKLYVVVAGSQGRSSAGLTPETNPGALIAASVMEPAQIKSHIVMVPGATTIEEALAPLGNAVTSPVLADTTFTSPEAQKPNSFYAALKTSDIPLALSNVKSVLKSLRDGTAKDPVLGIGPGCKK